MLEAMKLQQKLQRELNSSNTQEARVPEWLSAL